MLWPLPRHAGSAVQDPGDPIFEIWVIRAVQHGLATDPLNLYHANAFYPFKNSLAYSEEAISTALLAWPVQILTGNDILAYNLVLLSTFWLVAFGMYLFTRSLGAHVGAAVIAGTVAAFAPARYAQLSHLHMLVFGGLLLTLWAVTVWVKGGPRWYLAVAVLALTMQLLGSLHLAVYSTMVLGLYLPFLLCVTRTSRTWKRADAGLLAIALLVPYLIFVPTLLPHLAVGDDYGFTRTPEEVTRHSASLRNFVAVSITNRFWPDAMPTDSSPLFPGLVALAGAGLALTIGRRWIVWFAAVLGLLAATFSLGFSLHVAGVSIPLPYRVIYDLVTPLQGIRVVSRYGLMIAIAVPIMAAFGYSAAWERLQPRVAGRAKHAGLAITAVVVVIACIELRAEPGIWQVDYDPEVMAVYDWLGDQPEGPVMEFPANGLLTARSRPPDGLFRPIQYMYGSTRHWFPTVNGYSGFIPAQHHRILHAFATEDHPSLVTPDNAGLLVDLGVRYVIIHRFPGYDWEAAAASADNTPELRKLQNPGDSLVYEVVASDRQPVAIDVDIPATSQASRFANIHIEVTNSNPNATLLTLDLDPALELSWVHEDGRTYRQETPSLAMPFTVPHGKKSLNIPLATPDEPGVYTLQVRLPGTIGEVVERAMTVTAVDHDEGIALQFVGIDWDQTGDTIRATVSWWVLNTPGSDFAATLQILDSGGNRVQGVDILPGEGTPRTSEWQPGQLQSFTFHLPVDPAIVPGDYQLLTALYAYSPGYPRLLVEDENRLPVTEIVTSNLRLP